MPDIDPASITSINSIEELYEEIRQDSKAPSFALQYKGTWTTLMNNCGFSAHEAKTIEKRYHALYKVSDQWLDTHIENAKTLGYIPLAFGGRIRTPILSQTSGRMSYAAEAEARSAGNAATQSYCFLTIRAFNEFMRRVWRSKYRFKILPTGTIHDAIYLLVVEDVAVVKWVNDNLIDCMSWQELPELKHPTIKMSSSIEIYYPSWAEKIKIPNHATESEIEDICQAA